MKQKTLKTNKIYGPEDIKTFFFGEKEVITESLDDSALTNLPFWIA